MQLISHWERLFSTTPVPSRKVIEVSFEDEALRDALFESIPDLKDNPQPLILSRFLARCENLPLSNGNGVTYRFSLLGRRWRLLPFPAKVRESLDEA